MLTAVRFLEVLALGLWLGGMVFFAFVVAPAAFAVLPTRQQAGDLVAWVLPRLHFLGFVCGVAYLAGLFAEQRLTGGGRGWMVAAALTVVALLLILINHYGLGGQMAELRAQMTAVFGGVDQTPRDHALRLRFGRLHGYSSLLLSANLLLVLSLLVLTVRRFR
jgi:uncharacterized membrane protein